MGKRVLLLLSLMKCFFTRSSVAVEFIYFLNVSFAQKLQGKKIYVA